MMPEDKTSRTRQVEANGHPFRVIEQGSGPAVLFCHGFPDTAETWRSQMSAVAHAGYRAVALDMRGYGDSYSPADASLYSALHTVGDLIGVLDVLRIETAVLIGHDWGADVVQRAAVMRPDRVRAVVTLSIPPSPRGDVSFYEGLALQGMQDRFYAFGMMNPGAEADFEPAALTIPRILYWLSGSPPAGTRWDPGDPSGHMLRPAPAALPTWMDADYVRKTVRSFDRSGFHGGLNYYRAAQATFDLMAAFKNAPIRQPSLYVWGAEDGLCKMFHADPPTIQDLQAAAPGLLDVVRLEGVGHWVQHEARERLNATLLSFLDSIGRSDGEAA